ncbi:MAG: hypothetical protein PHC33_00320 [Candidatus Omnitrophica bacterium]|nr:hypothetical protein [Candidatus Omnitrophota bacterium]
MLAAVFVLGFWAGAYLYPGQAKQPGKINPRNAGNTIRLKRMEAIRKAAETGKNTYEFIFESTEGGGRQSCVPQ